MTKVFVALIFLSLVGVGVLWWLKTALPLPTKDGKVPTSEVVSTEEGVKIVDKAEKGEKSSKSLSENADGGEAPSESEKKDNGEKGKTEKEGALSIHSSPVSALVTVDGETRGETPLEIALTDKVQQVKVEAPGYKAYTKEAPTLKSLGEVHSLTWNLELLTQKKGKEKTPAEKALKAAGKEKKSVEAKAENASEKSADKSTEKSGAKALPKSKVLAKTEKLPEKTEAKSEPEPDESSVDAPEPPVAAKSRGKASTIDANGMLSGDVGPAFIQLKAFAVNDEKTMKVAVDKFKTDLNEKVSICNVDLGLKGNWLRVLIGPFESKRQAKARLPDVRLYVSDAFVTGEQKCQ